MMFDIADSSIWLTLGGGSAWYTHSTVKAMLTWEKIAWKESTFQKHLKKCYFLFYPPLLFVANMMAVVVLVQKHES